MPLWDTPVDYLAFERVLAEAQERSVGFPPFLYGPSSSAVFASCPELNALLLQQQIAADVLR